MLNSFLTNCFRRQCYVTRHNFGSFFVSLLFLFLFLFSTGVASVKSQQCQSRFSSNWSCKIVALGKKKLSWQASSKGVFENTAKETWLWLTWALYVVSPIFEPVSPLCHETVPFVKCKMATEKGKHQESYVNTDSMCCFHKRQHRGDISNNRLEKRHVDQKRGIFSTATHVRRPYGLLDISWFPVLVCFWCPGKLKLSSCLKECNLIENIFFSSISETLFPKSAMPKWFGHKLTPNGKISAWNWGFVELTFRASN